MRFKNQVYWAEKEAQKWESIALERSVTEMAYQMRLVIQGVYEWKDVGGARKLFGNRCAWVRAMRGQTEEVVEPIVASRAVSWGRDQDGSWGFDAWRRDGP